jgi:hypothetical protein
VADTFEELEHEARSGRRFVIRSASDRKVLVGHAGDATTTEDLYAVAGQAPARGSYKVQVAATGGREARTATVQFSFVAVRLVPPRQPRGEHSQEPLAVWVVRVWESDPPRGVEPLSGTCHEHPGPTGGEAREVIGYYECR